MGVRGEKGGGLGETFNNILQIDYEHAHGS